MNRIVVIRVIKNEKNPKFPNLIKILEINPVSKKLDNSKGSYPLV